MQIHYTTPSEDVALPAAELELAPHIVAAIAALRSGNVDGDEIRFKAAYRDLNAKGSGSQTYRKIVLPGRTSAEWPDAERMPALGGFRAGDRRCSVMTSAPVGTLIVDFESPVRAYRASKATLAIGILTSAEKPIVWCDYKAKRSTGGIVVELPDGSTVEIANPRGDDR